MYYYGFAGAVVVYMNLLDKCIVSETVLSAEVRTGHVTPTCLGAILKSPETRLIFA